MRSGARFSKNRKFVVTELRRIYDRKFVVTQLRRFYDFSKIGPLVYFDIDIMFA